MDRKFGFPMVRRNFLFSFWRFSSDELAFSRQLQVFLRRNLQNGISILGGIAEVFTVFAQVSFDLVSQNKHNLVRRPSSPSNLHCSVYILVPPKNISRNEIV
jgi:hypothetical protein